MGSTKYPPERECGQAPERILADILPGLASLLLPDGGSSQVRQDSAEAITAIHSNGDIARMACRRRDGSYQCR